MTDSKRAPQLLQNFGSRPVDDVETPHWAQVMFLCSGITSDGNLSANQSFG